MRKTLAIFAILIFASSLQAHDTDQFSMPFGEEMADLGPDINRRMVEAVREGVDNLNRRIRNVLEMDIKSLDPGSRPRPGEIYDPNGVLPRAHSPEGVAQAVYQAFGSAVGIIEGLERELYSDDFEAQYPDKLTAYKAKSQFESIYNKAYFPLDPRNVSAIFHASTLNAYGVYLGTDKIGHFTDMGHHYFRTYRNEIRKGKTTEEAMAKAAKIGTDGVFSESGLLGYLTAGSFSNADLVSNYTGCLFYRNLTEPVVIKGRLREPMLVRDGQYWKVTEQLDDDQFFERFVSDHLNEALNPSLYDPTIRSSVRKLVRKRNPKLLQWYSDRLGDQDPEEYFTKLARTLSTYYGEPYGHSGKFDELIHLGNTVNGKE